MKALTLQQPWATLIAIGSKEVETRKWHPQENPGTLVICSSKKPITGPAHERLLASEPYALHLDGQDTPRSAMLAIARLKLCARTEAISGKLSDTERAFGDYTRGRWAWILDDVVKLDQPVPLSEPPPAPRGQRRRKGQFRLGIWTLLPDDEKHLREALARQGFPG
jgi:hypothetical protein